MIGILTIHLHLESCTSLKQKRGRLRPLLTRLHREFNLSVAEMGLHDRWQESLIACAMVGNESTHLEAALQAVSRWVHGNWPDGMVIDDRIELM